MISDNCEHVRAKKTTTTTTTTNSDDDDEDQADDDDDDDDDGRSACLPDEFGFGLWGGGSGAAKMLRRITNCYNLNGTAR